jgi:transcriptional regulator with XRE-family HTH domain
MINPDKFYSDLGRRLRIARDDLGLTQQQVADQVGLVRASIANIERGRQRLLLHTFVDLCLALDITPAEIFAHWPGGYRAGVTPARQVTRVGAAIQAHTAREIGRLKP